MRFSRALMPAGILPRRDAENNPRAAPRDYIMGGMIAFCILLLVPPGPGVSTVEINGVEVRTSVRANVYTYTVTNHHPAPVCEFEVAYSDGYNFTAPEGWTITADAGVFRARVAEAGRPIKRGESGSFSFRITSRGGVLGRVDGRLNTIGGAPQRVPHLRGAVPLPRSYVLFVAGTVLALAGLYTARANRAARDIPQSVTAR